MKMTRTIKTVLFMSLGVLIGFSLSCTKVLALENPTVPITPSQPTSNSTSATGDGTQTASTSPSSTNPTTSTTPDPTTVNGSATNGASVSSTDNQSANSGASTVQNDPSSNQTTQPDSTVPVVGPTLPNTPDPCQVTTPATPLTPTAPTTGEASGSTSGNDTTVTTVNDACAASGNASVINNLLGGNATSGSATDIANLINAIASADNLTGSALQTFIDNICGQTGDININPTDLINALNATVPTTDVSATNNSSINNNVNLSATTGNANVVNNQVGGNATTGNALTEANIINLLNSIISDKQAFLGIINIFGNLNGNITLPSQLVDQLLTPTASSTGQPSPPLSNEVNNSQVNTTVNANAQSGNASVIGNGIAGNATTGNALTNVSICSVANSQIVGGNVLLVFVNVMGKWVGLLLNEPAGSTNAAIGGQISQDTSSLPTNVSAVNNNRINNNVTLNSVSGNALVSGNQIGGNATTGNATARANVVNLLGTNIDLTGWFGILVINVFGSWNGSLILAPIQSSAPTQSPIINQFTATTSQNTTQNMPMIDAASNNFFDPNESGQVELASFNSHTGIIHASSLTSSKIGGINNAQDSTKSHIDTAIIIIALVISLSLLVTEKTISVRKKNSK